MRPMIRYLKENYPAKLSGVEIGVFRGDNALDILKNLSITQLYLVDTCEYYQGRSDACDIALNKLTEYQDKIIFIIEKSEDATYKIPNELDFIYIDGNHEYEYVLKDIELYYNKIRAGGVIGGHDIIMSSVREAVEDFCLTYNLEYFAHWRDWWLIKP